MNIFTDLESKASNKLELNSNLQSGCHLMLDGVTTLSQKDYVHSLGVLLDTAWLLDKQVSAVARSASYYQRGLV